MRTLRSVVAAGVVLIAAGLIAAAAPAQAATAAADLSVRIAGTTFSGITAKTITIAVTNHGPATARGVHLRITGWIDFEVVDPQQLVWCRPQPPVGPVATPAPSPQANGPSDRVIAFGDTCDLPDLAPGGSHRLDAYIRPWGSALGQFGEITAAVSHDGIDPVASNNSATNKIIMNGWGPDLYARAWDVPVDQAGRTGAVPPGATTDLRFEIGNQGRVPVTGISLTIQLPRWVNFATRQPGCSYDTDRRKAVCVYRDLPIIPARDDTDPDDDRYSALRFRHRLTVSAAAPAPAHLEGGLVTVEPLGVPAPTATRTAGKLPEGVTGQSTGADTDASDNTDKFTVFTAAAGGGEGLPVTGPPGLMLAGLGLGGLIVGTGLVLLARQRRVTVVVPANKGAG